MISRFICLFLSSYCLYLQVNYISESTLELIFSYRETHFAMSAVIDPMLIYVIDCTIIPNTAVFGPTNFIGTTTTIATARMKILDEDF